MTASEIPFSNLFTTGISSKTYYIITFCYGFNGKQLIVNNGICRLMERVPIFFLARYCFCKEDKRQLYALPNPVY